MIQTMPSPRSLAASTKSSTTTFMETARASRNTRVESSTAMMMIRTGIDVPNMVSSSSAKISCGMAIRTSTIRLRIWSIQPPSAPPACPGAAKQKASTGCQKGNADGVSRAIEQAGEHVAAKIVGAEHQMHDLLAVLAGLCDVLVGEQRFDLAVFLG